MLRAVAYFQYEYPNELDSKTRLLLLRRIHLVVQWALRSEHQALGAAAAAGACWNHAGTSRFQVRVGELPRGVSAAEAHDGGRARRPAPWNMQHVPLPDALG